MVVDKIIEDLKIDQIINKDSIPSKEYFLPLVTSMCC